MFAFLTKLTSKCSLFFFRLRQINVTKMRAARAARTYSIIVFAVFVSFFFSFHFFGIARIYLRFSEKKEKCTESRTRRQSGFSLSFLFVFAN